MLSKKFYDSRQKWGEKSLYNGDEDEILIVCDEDTSYMFECAIYFNEADHLPRLHVAGDMWHRLPNQELVEALADVGIKNQTLEGIKHSLVKFGFEDWTNKS